MILFSCLTFIHLTQVENVMLTNDESQKLKIKIVNFFITVPKFSNVFKILGKENVNKLDHCDALVLL